MRLFSFSVPASRFCYRFFQISSLFCNILLFCTFRSSTLLFVFMFIFRITESRYFLFTLSPHAQTISAVLFKTFQKIKHHHTQQRLQQRLWFVPVPSRQTKEMCIRDRHTRINVFTSFFSYQL